MRVILARRRAGDAEPPSSVHAYRVPDDPASAPVWQAVCGAELKAADAEIVPQYTGAPCSICLLSALGEDAMKAPTTRDQRSRIGTRPAMHPISARGSYAVALAGERETHLVGPDAPRSMLDGCDVVHTLCGHLGWGPHLSPQPGWPICAECSDATGNA